MKPYIKFILIVAALAAWVTLNELSRKDAPAASGGCGCGGGSCSVTSPATSK